MGSFWYEKHTVSPFCCLFCVSFKHNCMTLVHFLLEWLSLRFDFQHTAERQMNGNLNGFSVDSKYPTLCCILEPSQLRTTGAKSKHNAFNLSTPHTHPLSLSVSLPLLQMPSEGLIIIDCPPKVSLYIKLLISQTISAHLCNCHS